MINPHPVSSVVEDYPKGEAVAISVQPPCDMCVYVERVPREKANRALYDAKTVAGPWANMCQEHMTEHGPGRLGVGYGQRLVIPGLGATKRLTPRKELQ